jgi:NADH-quinone oxidoreductase subunit J
VAETLFYLLAAGAVASGVGVIAARMPLFSVLSLLSTFLCLAGIFLLCGFQFLAATQLLVYAGAIMVLFLFVVMLLNLGDPEDLKRHTGIGLTGPRLAIAAAAAGVIALIGIFAAQGNPFVADAAITKTGIDDVESIAEILFSRYMLPFEAASLLLLATMIAVMMLAKRQRPEHDAHAEPAGWPWDKGVEQ